jgi:hypothetical protein
MNVTPADGSILDEIHASILSARPVAHLRIEALSMTSPFAVVELSDGAIGSALNYAPRVAQQGGAWETDLLAAVDSDPLLFGTTHHPGPAHLTAVRVAVMSALSQPLLFAEVLGPEGLAVRSVRDFAAVTRNLVRPGDAVTVIGFGGPWTELIKTGASALHITDESFAEEGRRREVEAQVRARAGRMGFAGEVVLAPRERNQELIERSAILSITGSTLCNGSLDDLLALAARRCREVVIQGPSASVLPVALFRRGVTHLLTTRKSRAELELARRGDHSVLAVLDRDYLHVHRC